MDMQCFMKKLHVSIPPDETLIPEAVLLIPFFETSHCIRFGENAF